MKQPIISPYDDRNCILEVDYHYRDVCVHAGFIFDGASVPICFRFYITPFNPAICAAALVHDWLYRGNTLDNGQYASRAKADRYFYDLMLAAGMGKMRAMLIYAGVRTFGWLCWREV